MEEFQIIYDKEKTGSAFRFSRSNRFKRQLYNARLLSSVIFFVLLGLGLVIGFIIPLRPTESEVEKRTLTSFPEFSMAALADGSLFDGMSTWYADSYPGREAMISIDNQIKELYGIQSGVELVGASIEADEIPDFEFSEASLDDGTDYAAANSISEDSNSINTYSISSVDEQNQSTNSENDQTSLTALASASPEETEEPEEEEPVVTEPPKSKEMEAEIKQHIEQSLYVKDDAAYALYYFSLEKATRYTGIIENTAQKLDGIATVYNILVPNSSCILPEEELASLGGTDQADSVHYYYSLYDKVKTVESVNVLKKHRDEYLFFRTDHHWTALGAYYVYRNYCAKKGITPNELDSFETMEFEPFLGSYYTSLRKPEMEANPDKVIAYIPHSTNDLTFYDENDVATPWSVIRDVSTWNKYSKYNCFIGSDRSWQTVDNPVLTDGESCLVIKESYGNAFVPFLVDHYSHVYVIDYRYCDKNIISFVKDNNIDDVIFINNISIIGSGGVLTKLESMTQ